ncbi:hypothetical protein L1987_19503 [Smallanthus sonchifolius]|uniref:Uncharacterized protein n=1 Tax=Smallanthus sonchifolius TaxID=185202 RepID=A0ACB9IRA9_9ASTR|nr:hypothetical protein L1987_19503 [Smallanthus sonchifolius]
MEEIYGSESSSGCESGWTLYLEHSVYPSHSLETHKNGDFKKDSFTHEVDDEEDMSMVSDASSGPQHFPEQEDECFKFNNNGGVYTNGKRKKIPKEPKLQKDFLDDTASSPFFNFSNNNRTVASKKASVVENEIIDYSQGYSTTYFKGESTFQDHFGFLHGAQLQQNQWLEGKRWG